MCGRYQANTEEEIMEIREIIDEIAIRIKDEDFKFLKEEVYPGENGIIINNKKEIVIKKWGFKSGIKG